MNNPPSTSGDGPSGSRPAVVRWLETAELVVGALLLTMIFALMLVQAGQRYVPGESWVWVGELARFGLVWLAFSLVGHLVGRDEHITLKLIDFVARGRALRAVWIFANLVVAATCALLVAAAADLVFAGGPQTTPVMGIPLSWTYVIPMVGLGLAVLRALANAVLLPGPPAPDTLPPAQTDHEEPTR
ncbi:TRAP transporter small permease subunit [Nocardiopsis sp. CT-R113]|uniref:TRAP transporter small permease subunit n=1 Tax=Nocardiopsis codii TaxID=3065942 RepID=A0ABU7KH17_9ACTN|nr:TRAP transporter small permease subunit [Nocardiopsis sp. CT-R113]MEE2041505.1 TRAP transporter small permease subunit [Nocardiopsis sp. CT-R113]